LGELEEPSLLAFSLETSTNCALIFDRFAIEQQLRKKRLEDVQKARDRLRAEIHEIKREKPEVGFDQLMVQTSLHSWILPYGSSAEQHCMTPFAFEMK
jgi:hypothetical protein